MDDLIRRSDAIRLAEQGQIQGFSWQFEQLVKLPSAQPTNGRYINADELIKRFKQAGFDDAIPYVVKMAGHERVNVAKVGN